MSGRWSDERWEEVEPNVYRRSGSTSTAAESAEPESVESQDAPGDTYDATAGAVELAAEYGIDLSTVTGTGANGRITKPDVQALVPE